MSCGVSEAKSGRFSGGSLKAAAGRPVSPVTGAQAELMQAGGQLLLCGLPAHGRASSLVSGVVAPRGACGLFSWKLVRIKSLSYGSVCRTEVDKHEWSGLKKHPCREKRAGVWLLLQCVSGRRKKTEHGMSSERVLKTSISTHTHTETVTGLIIPDIACRMFCL